MKKIKDSYYIESWDEKTMAAIKQINPYEIKYSTRCPVFKGSGIFDLDVAYAIQKKDRDVILAGIFNSFQKASKNSTEIFYYFNKIMELMEYRESFAELSFYLLAKRVLNEGPHHIELNDDLRIIFRTCKRNICDFKRFIYFETSFDSLEKISFLYS